MTKWCTGVGLAAVYGSEFALFLWRMFRGAMHAHCWRHGSSKTLQVGDKTAMTLMRALGGKNTLLRTEMAVKLAPGLEICQICGRKFLFSRDEM